MTRSMKAHDWISHHGARRPHEPAIVMCETGAALSYGEMNRQADSCAAFLAREHGVEANDRVALLAQSCAEVFVLQAACARLKATFLPLNWRLAAPELVYIASDAMPKIIIVDDQFVDTAKTIGNACTGCTPVPMGTGSEFESALTGRDRIDGLSEPTHDDIWMILYTSGTTGRPKGAMLSHGQILLQALALGSEYGVTHKTVGLTFTPTFHASGLFMFANPTLLAGGTTFLMRKFDPEACLRMLTDQEIGITHTLAIPTQLMMMRSLPAFDRVNFNGLVIPSGGAPVPRALVEIYAEHGAQVPQVWGMTELCGVATALPPEHALEKAGSSGPPLMNYSLRIVDDEGRTVPTADTVGEVVVSGPMVTRGYWGLGAKNEAHFLPGGWFKTGDAGSIDAEGYLTIAGRWKDMYISGGENVYPPEIEEVIYQMPEVDEVAIIGIPHDLLGETGRAYIVLKDGAELTEDAVKAHCLSQLAGYKAPKSVCFRASLPHSANGKILKHELYDGDHDVTMHAPRS